jgi:hypothetical protein
MKKYKKYVITLSQVFPVTHCRAGEETGFKDKFLAAIGKEVGDWLKLHTIRANCELWKKRFEEIEADMACLCIHQWSGRPYRSKQVEIARLTREDGIGIQELKIDKSTVEGCTALYGFVNGHTQNHNEFFETLAHNDGLAFADWYEWFKGYDLSKPLVIIHFTKFRY